MLLRRLAPLTATLALALSGCTNVFSEPQPADLVFASFDSTTGAIPTPNDLALQAAPGLTSPVQAAQQELLQAFIAAGGFPSDQEVPISIPIRAVRWSQTAGTTGAYVTASPPAIDLSTVTPATVAVLRVDGPTTQAPVVVAFDAAYANGVLSIRKKPDASGSRRWAPGGRYVAAVRGGPSGVRTVTGLPINADQPIALVMPNVDLTKDYNQPPPPGIPAALIPQLEALRFVLWNPLAWSNVAGAWTPAGSATVKAGFPAVDAVFPHAEVAAITTFGIDPGAGPVALIDAGSGQAPLPIDLLRTGPKGTIAFNAAFGPAAAGLATLDGFSTTGTILAQTSFPIDAGTVPGNVFLFQLGGPGPTLVADLRATSNPAAAGYVDMPTPMVVPRNVGTCPGSTGGCSPAIGLQPAVPVDVDGDPATTADQFFLPPLLEGTSYAVVITSRVKDVVGRPLAKPTVAKIILDAVHDPSLGGKSLLAGVDDATAVALTSMRAALVPVLAALPVGTARADVVTAYTFKTQSIAGTALSLSALPYSVEAGAHAALFTPTSATPQPLATLVAVGAATSGVASLLDVSFGSVDAIDKTSGALIPTLATDVGSTVKLPTLLTTLHALVAVPDIALVPACPPPNGAARCAPLVIFGHGINGSKETMYAVASSLASRGFIAAAVDFPLHGLRNWCSANSDCTTGTADGVCTPFPGGAGQGDAKVPGTCTGGSVPKLAASRYFISANFFRTRDAFRQNLLDQSALVLALARPPTSPVPAGNPFTAQLPAGLFVDPANVYYEGLSLGSLSGTSVVATNPRIERALLSVGGGTAVDVFTNSPAFVSNIDALFATLIPGYSRDKITPTSPTFDPLVAAAYLKTLNVAKWIVDPADPINFAQHVRTAPLPNLLVDPTGQTPQAAKEVLAQMAFGDGVVPNPFNLELDRLINGSTTLYVNGAAPTSPVSHSMLATIPLVQDQAAAYLLDPTTGTTPPVVPLP